jgi:O-antigen/teichoic acid export membrane protein
MASNPIAFSTWETQGDKESRVLLSEICRYYLLFAVPATVGLSVLSKPVMRILAAPSYFSGYEVIPLIAFSLFTIGIIDRFSTVLTFYKRTNLIMYCIIVCAILNLALNLFLIPKYGYMAAALTTFLAFASEMIMVIVISRRFLVWRFPYNSLLKTSLSAVLMGAGVLLISSSVDDPNLFSLIGMVCSGIGIYLVMLIVFREIRIEEIKKVCSLFSF